MKPDGNNVKGRKVYVVVNDTRGDNPSLKVLSIHRTFNTARSRIISIGQNMEAAGDVDCNKMSKFIYKHLLSKLEIRPNEYLRIISLEATLDTDKKEAWLYQNYHLMASKKLNDNEKGYKKIWQAIQSHEFDGIFSIIRLRGGLTPFYNFTL